MNVSPLRGFVIFAHVSHGSRHGLQIFCRSAAPANSIVRDPHAMGYRSFAAPRLVVQPNAWHDHDAKYVTCQIVAPALMVCINE